MTDLSVVIVSFNTRDLLRRCLTSLAPDSPSQVFVVDNASGDGSAGMVRDEFPSVELLASDTNLGFVKANNLALQRATGRLVLLLNPDAEATSGAVRMLQVFLDSHPTAGMVGPRLTYGDGALQHSAFAFPTLLQTYFEFFPRPGRLVNSRLNGRFPAAAYYGPPFRADFVLGACMMVRREAIGAVGLLDEGYFMYSEEVDWCWRMRQAGWTVWCEPRAVVIHHEGQSSRQTPWPSFVQKWRSRLRFYDKFYSPWWRAVNLFVLRAGLSAERRRAISAAQQGKITGPELAEMLGALDQVALLSRQVAAPLS